MKIFAAACLLLAAAACARGQAQGLPPLGGPYPPPFTATLSNNTPLVFGMSAEEAAFALGVPLNYVRGRPGDEIFLAFRDIGGSGLFPRTPPALSAIPQRPAGRLERRLGPELDVAIALAPASSDRNHHATLNKE